MHIVEESIAFWKDFLGRIDLYLTDHMKKETANKKELTFEFPKHKAGEKFKQHKRRSSKFFPYDDFPFAFHPMFEHVAPASGAKEKETLNISTENSEKNGKTDFLKTIGWATMKNSGNTTNVNCGHRRFAFIWSFDWRSLLMHIIVIMLFALIVTAILLFCQSLFNVQKDIKRVKLYSRKLTAPKGSKSPEKQDSSHVC
ncbi:hypothetical protein CDAR_151 [Caerostris darwini]|uniref:Uncharacterized protein n=1 Tax=Caerostris darwini TaxID=1538125 RepID=A0AAV4X047_9ARAC|nr:hypothetical protein CDAR_151 [Caerostris darwini]